MPTYLENLTLRLAQGMADFSDERRSRHARFLLAAQNADGGFSGREGASDLYYTGFGLRGLALVGELSNEPAERAAKFLRSRLTGEVAIIDFLSLVYGGMLLEGAAGSRVFDGAAADWREKVAAALERFRRPDGGYAKSQEGQSSSTYYSFLMTACNDLIGRAIVEPERLATFAGSRRRDDGGFVEIGPMRTSGTNPTAAGVGLLKILNAIDDQTREGALDYLVNAQNDEGGLTANTRIPMADVLSTFTGLLTMADLGALDEIDQAAARRFVDSLEQSQGGFRAAAWDEVADVEYTFYGLGALALLAKPAA